MASRYEGKPFLRLLECYVLDAIGELKQAEREKLALLEPELHKFYKVKGDWKSVVMQVMKFSPAVQDSIRSMWKRNGEIAIEQKLELQPEEFARMTVDNNFVKP